MIRALSGCCRFAIIQYFYEEIHNSNMLLMRVYAQPKPNPKPNLKPKDLRAAKSKVKCSSHWILLHKGYSVFLFMIRASPESRFAKRIMSRRAAHASVFDFAYNKSSPDSWAGQRFAEQVSRWPKASSKAKLCLIKARRMPCFASHDLGFVRIMGRASRVFN